MSFPPGQKQQCPICGHWVDVSSLSDGQRARCQCGINFIVRKSSIPQGVFRREPKTEIQGVLRDEEELKHEMITIPETEAEPVTETAHPAQPENISGVQIQRLITPPRAPQQHHQPPQQHQPLQHHQPPQPPRIPPSPHVQRPPAITAPAPALPVFDGYTIIERLGQGGNSDGLIVAIKVLGTEHANDESLVIRFEKEVAALATLDHPGIVKLVGRDFRRRPPFFAMELCDGQTLRERMSSSSFTIRHRLVAFSQLCRILAHAHARGVVHRDLKPDNVLFDAKNNLKLIDFGLAALVNGDQCYQLTQYGMTMGTAEYMPPEQRRDAKTVDARGDVWSLGIMLYELMSGSLPVGQFKALTERMPGLDPRLDTLVQRALIQDRNKRLQSAAEMADQIDEILSDMEKASSRSKTAQKSPLDKLWYFIRRNN